MLIGRDPKVFPEPGNTVDKILEFFSLAKLGYTKLKKEKFHKENFPI